MLRGWGRVAEGDTWGDGRRKGGEVSDGEGLVTGVDVGDRMDGVGGGEACMRWAAGRVTATEEAVGPGEETEGGGRPHGSSWGGAMCTDVEANHRGFRGEMGKTERGRAVAPNGKRPTEIDESSFWPVGATAAVVAAAVSAAADGAATDARGRVPLSTERVQDVGNS